MRIVFNRWMKQAAFGAVLATLIAIGSNIVHAQSGPAQIRACVNNASGDIKIIDATGECAGNTSLVTWTQEGGISGYEVRSRDLSASAQFDGAFGGLGCSVGKRPLGGGLSIDNIPPGYAIMVSRPMAPGDFGLPDPQGWFGLYHKVDSAASFTDVTARLWVICAAM